ncbi:unnamed protein product, partial [Prorocentrum cordatum]
AIKALMFVAAQQVRELLKVTVATSLELKHHWAMFALRGVRMWKGWMIGSALKCYPALSSHFNVLTFVCTNIR